MVVSLSEKGCLKHRDTKLFPKNSCMKYTFYNWTYLHIKYVLTSQVLKERVLRVSNYFRTLFKQLEENLLSSRTKKARAIEDFQSVHSPQSQSSKRVKKGKKQSVKKTANTGEVNI